MKVELVFQFGRKKKTAKSLDLIFMLSEMFGLSKSEVKRKWKEGAFGVYFVEKIK